MSNNRENRNIDREFSGGRGYRRGQGRGRGYGRGRGRPPVAYPIYYDASDRQNIGILKL